MHRIATLVAFLLQDTCLTTSIILGVKGDEGIPGIPGPIGADGFPGRDGKDGLPGPRGLPVSKHFIFSLPTYQNKNILKL